MYPDFSFDQVVELPDKIVHQSDMEISFDFCGIRPGFGRFRI